jgi:preprotein translocase subunit SecB
MSATPLQLESYLIDRLSVEAVDEYDGGVHEGGLKVSVTPQALRREDDALAHQIVIDVSFWPSEPGSAPYSGQVVARGFFHVADDLNDSEAQRYVLFNGGSILFGLMRAQVAQVTALGASGTFLIPPVNLVEAFENAMRDEAAEPKTHARKVSSGAKKAAPKALSGAKKTASKASSSAKKARAAKTDG